MKYLLLGFLFFGINGFGQLSLDSARAVAEDYQLGVYSYHEQFMGHDGYGAPLILTHDGGAAFFGDTEDESGTCGLMVCVNEKGDEIWKRTIRPEFSELESQSVLQDKGGNFYVFLLSYDYSRYRGGSERIICMDPAGEITWDRTVGNYSLVNSPTIAYIRLLDDGRIALRGHVVTDKPETGKDPAYRYWDGWINSSGELVQQAGDVIDWSDLAWQKRFSPDAVVQ